MSRPSVAMTKGAHIWGKVGAPVQSFTPNRQRECVPRWKPVPVQLMAAANVVVETIPDLKLPFMPAAANAGFPPGEHGVDVPGPLPLCAVCSMLQCGFTRPFVQAATVSV